MRFVCFMGHFWPIKRGWRARISLLREISQSDKFLDSQSRPTDQQASPADERSVLAWRGIVWRPRGQSAESLADSLQCSGAHSRRIENCRRASGAREQWPNVPVQPTGRCKWTLAVCRSKCAAQCKCSAVRVQCNSVQCECSARSARCRRCMPSVARPPSAHVSGGQLLLFAFCLFASHSLSPILPLLPLPRPLCPLLAPLCATTLASSFASLFLSFSLSPSSSPSRSPPNGRPLANHCPPPTPQAQRGPKGGPKNSPLIYAKSRSLTSISGEKQTSSLYGPIRIHYRAKVAHFYSRSAAILLLLLLSP